MAVVVLQRLLDELLFHFIQRQGQVIFFGRIAGVVNEQLGRRERRVHARIARIRIQRGQRCDNRPGVSDRDRTTNGHRRY